MATPKHPDPQKVAETYNKTHYRLVGPNKHSAVKPCHWQTQRLLTGRDNRNCYKGYFGIQSHLCVQNTPALPFCNHQCVFCWRDIENGSLGSTWEVPVDDPKLLAEEMIRHSINMIFNHFTKARSLENLKLMREVMQQFLIIAEEVGDKESLISESEMAQKIGSTVNKMHRAMLILKNCEVLANPVEKEYQIHPRIRDELNSPDDISMIITRDVTTEADIERSFEEAANPRHAAISLAGEPTLYPRLGELIQEFRDRHIRHIYSDQWHSSRGYSAITRCSAITHPIICYFTGP